MTVQCQRVDELWHFLVGYLLMEVSLAVVCLSDAVLPRKLSLPPSLKMQLITPDANTAFDRDTVRSDGIDVFPAQSLIVSQHLFALQVFID